MNSRILLFAWCASLVVASLAEARKWTDMSGNQINAEYVRIHEGEVLLKQGTRLIRCPYDQFSELDKAYIRDQMDAERNTSKRRTGLNQIGGPVAPDATDDGARELRTWHDIQGNKILAQYAGFSLGRVELLKDGRRVSYSYGAFGYADQAYVAQILIAEGRADEIPKKKQEGDGENGGHGEGSSAMENDYMPSEPDYDVANSSHEGSGSYDEPEYESDDGMNGEPDYGSEPSNSYDSPSTYNSSRPSSNSSGSPQLVMKKKCMKCNGIVPDDTEVGDRCPHCNVRFGYEVGADGKRTSTGNSWLLKQVLIRLAALGFVVFIIVAAVMSRR